jgi:hypothetical protein
MASGFLGKSNPAANTWTNIYAVPSAKVASISINAVNTAGLSAGIDIAVSTSATSGSIAVSEYLDYAMTLPALGSSYERSGIVTDATNGKYVWVRANSANISFQVYGYEE